MIDRAYNKSLQKVGFGGLIGISSNRQQSRSRLRNVEEVRGQLRSHVHRAPGGGVFKEKVAGSRNFGMQGPKVAWRIHGGT